MKLRLAVVEWLLPDAGKAGDPPSPRLRRTSEGKDLPTAADWKDAVRDFPVAVIVAQAAEHVPAASVEVTLYGGPADGWMEQIPAGKPWPEMMLVKVGMEVHAYEQVSGRALYRYVRKVGVQGKR